MIFISDHMRRCKAFGRSRFNTIDGSEKVYSNAIADVKGKVVKIFFL